MTLSARRQFLLYHVKAGHVVVHGPPDIREGRHQWCIDREPGRYPKAERQPSDAEMSAMLREGLIDVRRVNVTKGSPVSLRSTARRALKKIGG